MEVEKGGKQRCLVTVLKFRPRGPEHEDRVPERTVESFPPAGSPDGAGRGRPSKTANGRFSPSDAAQFTPQESAAVGLLGVKGGETLENRGVRTPYTKKRGGGQKKKKRFQRRRKAWGPRINTLDLTR